MDLTAFRAVFFLLAWFQDSAADVAPPTNVTLQCHNMKNVLKWSYEDPPPPGLRFKVHIGSQNNPPDEKWVDPPAQHLDVSFLNNSEDDYIVDVTAVIGQNKSAYAPPNGITFSYWGSSLATQKCNVDFPLVNVTPQDDGSVLFRFAHPWLLYFHEPPRRTSETTRKKKRAALPHFKYGVQIVNQKSEHHFSCTGSVCEEKLPVNAAQEKLCLKMHGELEKISVQATQAFCALRQETTSWSNTYLLPFCVCGALGVLFLLGSVVLMLYRKGTTANIALPNFLMYPNKPPKATHTMPKEAFNVPQVGPASPTPLLQAEEEDPTPFGPRFTEPEFRLPLGVSPPDEGLVVDVGGGRDGEPGYMAGRDLDEEDEAPYSGSGYTGYEKRPVLDNLSPGDLTEGYRG